MQQLIVTPRSSQFIKTLCIGVKSSVGVGSTMSWCTIIDIDPFEAKEEMTVTIKSIDIKLGM